MTRSGALPAVPASALTRLLEVESRLDAMLEEARLRAAMLVGTAEAEATVAAADVDRELAEAEARAAGRCTEASAERLRTLAQEREAVSVRLSRCRSDRVETLAAWAAEQVIAAVVERGGGA